MKLLNDIENAVLQECERQAEQQGDNSLLFCFDDIHVDGLTRGQLKGYISQLIQKGCIEKIEDEYYFDFEIIK